MNRKQILEAAMQGVTKDRNTTHGEPEDNFKAIAGLWNAYMDARSDATLGPIITITIHDVAVLNILQKVARAVTSPECPDHWIDIAGYAACGGGIGEPITKESK